MPSIENLPSLAARAAFIAALIGSGIAQAATTYEGTPNDYRRLVGKLRPGDTLALAPGLYRDGLALHNLAGEPDRPITIAGPTGGAPAVFVANAERNTVSILDSHHIVVKNLVLDGSDLPVGAVTAEGHARYAHHVTIENLLIRRHGNDQGTVAISTRCPAWNWVIRGNTIIGAGTGMYLGGSTGNAPFIAGVIEHNLIVDTIGYNLQVKHQHRRPEIDGMPAGASITVIRRNVFSKAAGGSTDAARPNVLVGHFPPEGPGIDDRYVIYGNFFYANASEALFQGEGNVALYNNLFVNPLGDAIHIRPHNGIPKNIDIAFNTVVARDAGISVLPGAGSAGYRQAVVGNAVFAATPIQGGAQAGNFAAPFAETARYLARPFAKPGELDLVPRMPLTDPQADAPNPARLVDWDRDFDRRARKPGSIGAYSSAGANPAWRPALSLMPD